MLEKKSYKNWKEICEAMEWKTICGNYKKARLKDLGSMCKYHKEGQKIVIDEIYENPIEKNDNRKNNGGHNTSKLPEIQRLIVYNLVNYYDIDEDIYMSIGEMVGGAANKDIDEEGIELYTADYRLWKKKKNAISLKFKIDIQTVIDFYNMVDTSMKGYVKTALNNTKGLTWNYGYVVSKHGEYKNEIKEASEEEVEAIKEEEQNVLKEMNIKNIQQVILKGLVKDYYKKLTDSFAENSILKEYDYIYKAYHIKCDETFRDTYENDFGLSIITEEEIYRDIYTYKNNIKDIFTNKIININTRYIKKTNKYRATLLRQTEKWVEDMNRLVDILVLGVNRPDDYNNIRYFINSVDEEKFYNKNSLFKTYYDFNNNIDYIDNWFDVNII